MCAVGAITQTPYTQLEPAQDRAFVGHAVLQRHDGDRRWRDGGKRADRVEGRVALDREQDHVVVPPVDLVRPPTARICSTDIASPGTPAGARRAGSPRRWRPRAISSTS